MDQPCFSVIMPIYNTAAFLERSIRSVLEQSIGDFELICIDDGSTDGSSEILEHLEKTDIRLRRFRLPTNQGRCIARNTGLDKARARWICFLDSDDIYYPHHLQTFRQMMNQHQDRSAFATEIITSDQTQSPQHEKKERLIDITFRQNIFADPVSLNQLCYDRTRIPIRFPNIRLPISEDWLFLRELSLQTPILKTSRITNEYILHPGSTMHTTDPEKMAEWNLRSAQLLLERNSIGRLNKMLILSHTYLLCANILINGGRKGHSYFYLSNALVIPTSYFDILLYKAFMKLLFRH